MDKNEVIIRGKIVNKYETKNDHILLTIKTCKHNYPAIFFPKAVSADKAIEYEIGDNVEIVGSIQSSKKGGSFTCSIFGTDIYTVDNDDRRNIFELYGRVIKFETLGGNMYRLMIESEVDNHYSTVPVVFYNKKHEKVLLERDIGQMIKIKGVVQTKKACFLNGSVVYYVNYVGFSCA